MAGILVQLALSWIILWFFAKEHLTVLGIIPTKKRLINLCIGFGFAAICCVLYFGIKALIEKSAWRINHNYSLSNALSSSWWVFISVLYEELIFRGALLYLAIKKLGAKKACILSAVSFGIYHWFTFNAWGNPMAMIFVFFMTGIWGYMFAMAFVKTKSLYLPIGLHLGWNLVNMIVFSFGAMQTQFIVKTPDVQLPLISWLTILLIQTFTLPVLIFWYLRLPSNKENRMIQNQGLSQ